MKRKTFYLLVLICCLSVFSSAKQSDYKCCKKISSIMNESGSQQSKNYERKNGVGFDLSPLQLFVFNI